MVDAIGFETLNEKENAMSTKTKTAKQAKALKAKTAVAKSQAAKPRRPPR